MKILGIDPGIGTIGFGLVEVIPSKSEVKASRVNATTWGVIKTTPKEDHATRLEELYNDLTQLLQTLAPDVIALEKLFYFRNVTTMLPVSQARGVILLAIKQNKIPVFEYTPLQIKQIITGYGKASKGEIQTTLVQLLQLNKRPTPDDAADGLALALCYHQTEGQLNRLNSLNASQKS
ncbi:MAG: crossover junction endodeoxyribonuclease RuvC [Cyanobacteria bacterium P01_H01_bin.74]